MANSNSIATAGTARRVGRRSVLAGIGAAMVGAATTDRAGASTVQSAMGPTVYSATGNSVAAVDVRDGTVRWNLTDLEAATEAVTVVDGIVYGVEQRQPRFRVPFALDAVTGERAWTHDGIDAWVEAGPTVVGDTCYFAAGDGRVVAIDRHSGETRWAESIGDNIGRNVTVAYGTIFASTGLDAVTIDASDGSRLWSHADITNSGPVEAPTVVDDLVYYGTRAGVTALNVADGSPAWSTDIPDGSSYTEVVADGQRLYVTDYAEGVVAALDPAEGDRLWTASLPSGIPFGPPTVGADTVFVSTYDFDARASAAYALAADDGEQQWAIEQTGGDGGLWSTPTAYDGTAYFGDDAGNIRAVDATSGTEHWRANVDDFSVTSTPMVVEEPADGAGLCSKGRLGVEGHHDESIHYSASLPDSMEVSASFVAMPSAPSVDDDLTLDAGDSEPDAFLETYSWRIDGSALDTDAQHVEPDFDAPGVHEVALTVGGPGDRTATTTEPLVVREREPTVASYAHVDTGRVTEGGVAAAKADEADGRISEGTLGRVVFAWMTETTVA